MEGYIPVSHFHFTETTMRGPFVLPTVTTSIVPVFSYALPLLLVMSAPAAAQTNDAPASGSALFVIMLLALLLIVCTVAWFLLRRRGLALSEQIGLYSHRIDALQRQLIEREKLASLGQLTAGIAHEIKNPLNFVTNFSDLSRELIEELQGASSEEERDDILSSLRQNLLKISEHGHRADDIVRGMMLHARGGSTSREAVDLNALISESAHLAYHAMRAQQDGFNCTIELELEQTLPHPPIVRQDIGRVLLNIMQNAMQAVHQREKSGEHGYAPKLWVQSATVEDCIEVRISDNGMGIAPEVRERIFEPFFTTKEADKGTGLGLSIARDIVVTQHGGRIRAEDAPGGGAQFILEIPIV
jgi:two-component system, NtrC family, sensor kinase